uniref:Uncharacterized protein n=1 Tax=Picea sitchensis TaxID=3332 RepID=A9NYR6_PICSI|nr:unknown [Picea sitchensis]ACN40485.1 unknown [Picea sitchensis]
MAQAVACNDQCSIPRRLNLSRLALPSSRCWKSPRRIGFRVRAADEAEECNEEACAPEKEVGKVSMEWAFEERTKVLGTFPPTTKQRWTGYVEKDTAGQTNIYSVEPTMYVADSAISSGEAGTSTTGADNKVAISFGLALIFLAGSSSVLLQVGKDPPNAESLEYSGPPLNYYIKKFNTPLVIETSAPVEIQSAPSVTYEPITTLSSSN